MGYAVYLFCCFAIVGWTLICGGLAFGTLVTPDETLALFNGPNTAFSAIGVTLGIAWITSQWSLIVMPLALLAILTRPSWPTAKAPEPLDFRTVTPERIEPVSRPRT